MPPKVRRTQTIKQVILENEPLIQQKLPQTRSRKVKRGDSEESDFFTSSSKSKKPTTRQKNNKKEPRELSPELKPTRQRARTKQEKIQDKINQKQKEATQNGDSLNKEPLIEEEKNKDDQLKYQANNLHDDQSDLKNVGAAPFDSDQEKLMQALEKQCDEDNSKQNHEELENNKQESGIKDDSILKEIEKKSPQNEHLNEYEKSLEKEFFNLDDKKKTTQEQNEFHELVQAQEIVEKDNKENNVEQPPQENEEKTPSNVDGQDLQNQDQKETNTKSQDLTPHINGESLPEIITETKQQKFIDIVFCCEIGLLNDQCFEQLKIGIHHIFEQIKKDESANIKFSIVCYRENIIHEKTEKCEMIDLCAEEEILQSLNEIKEKNQTESQKGFYYGLKIATTTTNWRQSEQQRQFRYIIHITDKNLELTQNINKSEELEQIIKEMNNKNIRYKFLKICSQLQNEGKGYFQQKLKSYEESFMQEFGSLKNDVSSIILRELNSEKQ